MYSKATSWNSGLDLCTQACAGDGRVLAESRQMAALIQYSTFHLGLRYHVAHYYP